VFIVEPRAETSKYLSSLLARGGRPDGAMVPVVAMCGSSLVARRKKKGASECERAAECGAAGALAGAATAAAGGGV
jgi:hypothetical protein